MVRSDTHMFSLKKRMLQAVLENSEALQPNEAALLEAPLDRVARIVDEILARLEACERFLLELIYGLGDGYTYSHNEAAYVFGTPAECLIYDEGRILSKCRQVLEHMGV
jgi:hypothetical protein